MITGDRVEVTAAVDRARADGRLIGVTQAMSLPGGQVQLIAHLRAQAGSRRLQLRRWLVGLGKTLAVLAALTAVAGLVWAAVWAFTAAVAVVGAAVAWVHAHVVSIAITVVLGLVMAAKALIETSSSEGHGCGGAHCRGCGR